LAALPSWAEQIIAFSHIKNQDWLSRRRRDVALRATNRLLASGKAAVICENSWKILAENSRFIGIRGILKIARTYFQQNF